MAITSKWNKPVAWSLGVGAESVHRGIFVCVKLDLCKHTRPEWPVTHSVSYEDLHRSGLLALTRV